MICLRLLLQYPVLSTTPSTSRGPRTAVLFGLFSHNQLQSLGVLLAAKILDFSSGAHARHHRWPLTQPFFVYLRRIDVHYYHLQRKGHLVIIHSSSLALRPQKRERVSQIDMGFPLSISAPCTNATRNLKVLTGRILFLSHPMIR